MSKFREKVIQEKDQEAPELEIKKVTLDSVLNREDVSNIKEYHSIQLGGIIDIKRINPEKISSIIAEMNSGKVSELITYQRLVYLSCDFFQNKEFIAKYTPPEPFEVVYPVLNKSIAEIYDIGNEILEWYGFDTDLKK